MALMAVGILDDEHNGGKLVSLILDVLSLKSCYVLRWRCLVSSWPQLRSTRASSLMFTGGVPPNTQRGRLAKEQ